MLTHFAFLCFLRLCRAQIPNSDVGNYPSGVVTLIAASWLFFSNSTSTLYGVLPQYWLMPGLQTSKKQFRDGLNSIECCKKNCYNGIPTDIIDLADKLRKRFADKGVDLESASKQIVASGSWTFSVLSEASDEEIRRGSELFLASIAQKDREQHWLSEFRCWEEDVSAAGQRFWISDRVSTPAELLNSRFTVKTFDAISIRVGSRRRTMNFPSVAGLLAHSVAAAAARDAQGCIVFEAILISIWAGVASFNRQGPTTTHVMPLRHWRNPVLVSASTEKMRALMPQPGTNTPYDPIEAHGMSVYIVLITAARVIISGATALGTSGSLWLAVFTGLYLTNPSAASSFGREDYDARADCGIMSGMGFYVNFSRDTMPVRFKLHDKLENISVILSLASVIVIRLFKLRLRSLLGYNAWVPSAPWQMVPGSLLCIWASLTHGFELKDNVIRKELESKDVTFILYRTFIFASCVACACLGLASVITAYGGYLIARSLRWTAYGVAEFHSWHVGIYEFGMGKVDGPDMWFAETSALGATWGAVLLAVAADLGDSLL